MSIEHNDGFVVLRNPHSTNARHGQPFIDEIEADYGNVRHIETSVDWLRDAETIAAELRPGDTLVAIGGDGTMHRAANGMMLYGEPNASMFAIPMGNGNDTVHNLRGHSGQSLRTRFAHGELRKVHPIDISHSDQTRYALSYWATGGLTAAIAQTLDSDAHREKTAETSSGIHLLHDIQAGAGILFGRESLEHSFKGIHNGQRFEFLEFAIMNGPRVAKLTNAHIDMYDPEYLKIVIEKAERVGTTRRQVLQLFAQLCLGVPVGKYRQHGSSVQYLTLAQETPVHYDAEVKKRDGTGMEMLPADTEVRIRRAVNGFSVLVPKAHPRDHWITSLASQ